jgi:LuxR family maltose regulon positive regulatory protein
MHDRIVAIVAPAGYGKTTLMGGWFRACKDADPVWVGRDASWRDQVFFVRSLLNAVECPSEPVAMGAIDATAAVESGLLALLQALGQRRRPMVLFFDDVHALVAERALTRLADMGLRPVLVRILRTRCAQWWHARGEVYRAIRVALEGDDARLASAYLTGYARQLVQGEGRQETFLDLLAQLESRGVEPD